MATALVFLEACASAPPDRHDFRRIPEELTDPNARMYWERFEFRVDTTKGRITLQLTDAGRQAISPGTQINREWVRWEPNLNDLYNAASIHAKVDGFTVDHDRFAAGLIGKYGTPDPKHPEKGTILMQKEGVGYVLNPKAEFAIFELPGDCFKKKESGELPESAAQPVEPPPAAAVEPSAVPATPPAKQTAVSADQPTTAPESLVLKSIDEVIDAIPLPAKVIGGVTLIGTGALTGYALIEGKKKRNRVVTAKQPARSMGDSKPRTRAVPIATEPDETSATPKEKDHVAFAPTPEQVVNRVDSIQAVVGAPFMSGQFHEGSVTFTFDTHHTTKDPRTIAERLERIHGRGNVDVRTNSDGSISVTTPLQGAGPEQPFPQVRWIAEPNQGGPRSSKKSESEPSIESPSQVVEATDESWRRHEKPWSQKTRAEQEEAVRRSEAIKRTMASFPHKGLTGGRTYGVKDPQSGESFLFQVPEESIGEPLRSPSTVRFITPDGEERTFELDEGTRRALDITIDWMEEHQPEMYQAWRDRGENPTELMEQKYTEFPAHDGGTHNIISAKVLSPDDLKNNMGT